MSWLNFNDSLNNLKGQISNFASNVLADEFKDNNDVEDLQRVCASQQEEINSLRNLNDELQQGQVQSTNNDDQSHWAWNVSAPDKNEEIISTLKRQIANLESEKRDLTSNLELLDSDYQQNNEKLVSIKDKLQNDYNELEEKYVKLKDENEASSASKKENKILVAELKKANEEIAAFRSKSEIDEQNFKKLASILEGYEQQVSSLKQELELSKKNEDKEQTHKKYISILAENIKRYVDCDNPVLPQEDDPHLKEFGHQVENLLKVLHELNSKCEKFEQDLYNVTQEKTELLEEKNNEIEKLIQNSEILSQEVITKSQTIKDYENECNELIKNNELLIGELEQYKNNSGLQTISESNEDNLLLLESQLETANKRIEELENTVVENRSKNKDEFKLPNQELLQELTRENEDLKDNIKMVQEEAHEENEHLTSHLEKMKTELENTEYQYTELNVQLEALREETENQKKKNSNLEKINTELERNNEDIRTELNVVRERFLLEEEKRHQLEGQIRSLTEKLQNAKMIETSLKLQHDTANKEIVNVSETKSVLEVSLKNTLDELQRCQDNFIALQAEGDELRKICESLEKKVKEYEEEIGRRDEIERVKQFENIALDESGALSDGLRITNNEFETINLNSEDLNKLKEENTIFLRTLEDLRQQLNTTTEERNHLRMQLAEINNQYSTTIADLTNSKNELTKVVLVKHEESITYHKEIQRLSHILNGEVQKSRNFQDELAKKNEEIEKLIDQNNFLRQKCEVMAENLLEEQNKLQQVLASEKEQALNKKLERLQSHLIEVEEHYTQELLKAEGKNAELQLKMNEIEQREKNSSTMYTSVSIRANQQVETLHSQLQMITNQRDELRRRISDADDNANKQAAALANLQFVLEQFQKDKEQDVQSETERIRRQISAEKRIQEDLRKEILGLQSQLEESKQGLQAASRLSDQLEQSKHLVLTLKSEVSQLKEKLCKHEEEMRSISSQADGKVDKSLIKSLVIGFISSNNNLNKDQTQILKIISNVLDFNQQDHDKVKNKEEQGWLSSILSPQTSQGMSQESLSQAFVKFLENESKPRVVPSLLSSEETPNSRKSSNTSAPRHSPIVLSEVLLPTFADFAQNRNSSSILKDVLKDNS